SLYTRDGKLVWVPQNVDRWDEYPNINQIFSTLNRFGKDDFVLHHGPLRKMAANLLERNVPPSPWRDYILFILRNLAPSLSPRRKRQLRDGVIAFLVNDGIEAGLRATRGRDQRYKNGAHSACSLVVDELKQFGLNLGEEALEKIWRRSEKMG